MSASAQEIESVHGIPLPLELARAQRTRIVDYEPDHPGMGISASYVNGYYKIALYVYDLGLTDIPDNPMSAVVTDHFRQAISEALTVAHSRGEKLQCKGAHGAPYPPGVDVAFLVAKLGRENDNDRFTSFIFLTTKNRRFVKLRVSFVQSSLTAESLASTIVTEYFSLLWPNS